MAERPIVAVSPPPASTAPLFLLKPDGDRIAVRHHIDLPAMVLPADQPKDLPAALAGQAALVADTILKHLENVYAMKLDKIELAGLPLAEVGERIADLTLPIGEDPAREQSAAFIIEAERFYAMLAARDEAAAGKLSVAPGFKLPHVTTWWTDPLPAADLPSLVPAGRQFHVWYMTPAGWAHLWFFPDADGGIFTDHEFRQLEPPASVWQYAESVRGN